MRHVSSAGYDIEVIDSDALRRAVSQVKWPTPNPSGSTAIDLIHGPAADLLWLAVNNLPFYIAIEPLLSFLKDTFCDAGLGSTASKSDLMMPLQEKYTYVMIRVCHSRSPFLSCMYIHDDFMTESR